MLLKMRLRLAQASLQARKAFSTAWRSSAVISVLPLLSVCSLASVSCSCTRPALRELGAISSCHRTSAMPFAVQLHSFGTA